MDFRIIARDNETSARTGVLLTDHGEILTPVFMPVGTAGTVKAVHQRELDEEINATMILGNTYHLYLRPGTQVINKAGGLHKFINWKKPILTDSGGYQVFSLAEQRKLTEEGAIFQSHIDGSKHTFTPESVVDIQRWIGADIIMALDECTPYPSDRHDIERATMLTGRWAKRFMDEWKRSTDAYNWFQDWA